MIPFCEKCHGVGEIPSGHATLYGGMAWRVCPLCDGTGLDEEAAAAELASEADFSVEAIDADLAAFEAQRAVELSRLPVTDAVPF